MFLNFYKKGLKDIWFNYKSLRKEVFNKYHIDNKIIVPGKKNAIAKVKIINNRNNKQLIKILNNTINNYKNEYRATNDFKKFFNNKYEISLKRSDFVKLLRTGKDIAKIPMFGLIFIIFEELTVLICYLFPSITPSTCILPQLSSRYYQSSKMAQNKLGKVVIKHQDQIQKDIIKYASRTPYTITEEELYPLIDLFKLRSPLIPLRFYSTETLRDNLQLKFQEILVDNFLILRDGGIWNLNKLELLDACINRGLINYDKLIKASRESNKSLYDSIDQNILRLRLFKFINDLNLVETTNVGYLSLNGCSMDMIDNIDPNKSLTFIRQTLVNNL
ncbi:hypothetical protein PACTADRAFT_48482 [Pachysolen tannophilus NRRL Y-2460]|uniref:Letm1 RBD domain-containing protein n=1 Tax=Pachysolen tannophilus NRRL Y-2460 TaxID=669874 RepID=A0A1E4TXZ4_PACTA|nr:hypothetical protein PACTADRAFT_48482 [Pachysolen tannophilus NRRL Y-2460]